MHHSFLAAIAAFSVAAGTSFAQEKDGDHAKKLQGTWQAIAIEANGQPSPDDQVRELQIVFQGDEVYAVKPQGADPKSKFKLNPGKSPKWIDVIPLEDSGNKKVGAGIYSLEDGKLRVCVNLFGKDPSQRPTDFKTSDGDGIIFVTLERAKPR